MTFTFFFRDIDALKSVSELIIPDIKEGKKIRIWDAGSSKGCEPFSLSIILSENLSELEFSKVNIDASDIDENNAFEKIINSGIYPLDDLKRMPKELFEKYFSGAGQENKFKISDKILRSVTFYNNDLRELKPIRKDYKLIICKNVLLHLQPQQRVEVIRMFHSCLMPGGYFTTELSQDMPEEVSHLFEKVSQNCKVYKKIG